MTHMYKDKNTQKEIPTWNPFNGCDFNCKYCKLSFQRQAKRQKQRCLACYSYEPHFHPERLNKIPKADLVFACGNGDISFAEKDILKQMFEAMENKSKQTFLLQTKNPSCLIGWDIPSNVIVGTTIETNYDTRFISDAPIPKYRIVDLWLVEHDRKFITHEPLLEFDLDTLIKWDKKSNLEMVWIGYCNHNKNKLNLIEPSIEKTNKFISELEKFTEVRLKTIRDKE